MVKKPNIGISGNQMCDPSGIFPGYKRSYVNHDYILSVLGAGGVPFILPFNEKESIVSQLVQHMDGLILTGGDDISPLFYNEEPTQKIGPIFPERDRFDFLLLNEAMKKNIPILGICRGHQIINVYFGGSLYQDLSYDKNCTIKHAQNQRPELPTHTVEIEEDSRLHRILNRTEWRTNSHHHQTIHQVGKGLRVTAHTKDGTIEGLEHTSYPYLVSYQFHPEMMQGTDKEAQLLFKDFINACCQRQEQ